MSGRGWSRIAVLVCAVLGVMASLLGAQVTTAPPAAAVAEQIFDGPNAPVHAVAVDDDGNRYVGGDFTWWGPQTGGGAGVSQASGNVLRTLPPVDGVVYATLPDGAGGWYIGGSVTSVAGVQRNNAAHVLATGEVDPR